MPPPIDAFEPTPPASSARYHPLAVVLHWLLASMIVGTIVLGLYMTGLPFSMQRLRLFNWHKWIGITILALSLLRLGWRLRHPPPPLPASVVEAMPGWQRVAHSGTHRLLYVLFFVVPLLGWAYSSAYGFPVVLFGVLPLPDLWPVDKPLAENLLKPLHQAGAFALAGLALLHALAAIKHHFFDHDGLLDRMRLGSGRAGR